MYVEFDMKWTGDMTEEEREEIRQSRLLNQDDNDFVRRRYSYQPLSLNLELVEDWNATNDNHTAVRTKRGYFELRVPYYKFRAIMEIKRGIVVQSHKEFKFLNPNGTEFDEEDKEDDLIL